MATKKPSVGRLFETVGTGQSHQILQLKDQVAELEAEVLRLRNNPSEDNEELEQQIRSLTEQLTEKEGVHDVEIKLIDPDPNQPRQTITAAMKQTRAESLRKHGQLSPVILVPQPTGRYLLFDGELRWQSAPLVPLPTLRAVFLRQDQQKQDAATIFRGQLLTRLHTEDLHDLDLAEALIQDIRNHIPELTVEEIPKLLDASISHLRKVGQFADLSKLKAQSYQQQQDWITSVQFPEIHAAKIILILLELQRNPASIASNIFPMLKLPQDLKGLIRETGIESSKARALAMVTATALNVDESKAELIRQQAGKQVVNELRSLAETRQLVQTLIEQHNPAGLSKSPKAKKMFRQIETLQFKDLDPTEIKQIQTILQQKLKELDEVWQQLNAGIKI